MFLGNGVFAFRSLFPDGNGKCGYLDGQGNNLRVQGTPALKGYDEWLLIVSSGKICYKNLGNNGNNPRFLNKVANYNQDTDISTCENVVVA